MQYDAKIVTHSISALGNDIVTFEVTMPKWLVAEWNTHKVEIERNSASSRAVPTKIIIDMVQDYPCIPLWTYNQSGMAANEKLNEEDAEYATKVWLEARDTMIEYVRRLQKLPSGRSVSKGVANRPLEFVMWTKVVTTFTGGGHLGINNFFGLRDNEAAQPEFHEVAYRMHEQYHASTPKYTEWHLPYINKTEVNPYSGITFEQLALISSARCGRVTHYKQGQEFDEQKEIERGKGFFDSGHFSPLRHAAQAGDDKWYGNMYGWNPISKIISEGKDYVQECCELHNTVDNGNVFVGPNSKQS